MKPAKAQIKEMKRLAQMLAASEKELKTIKAATIERCAQVADERAADLEALTHQDNASRLASEMLRKAAARIRTMKEDH